MNARQSCKACLWIIQVILFTCFLSSIIAILSIANGDSQKETLGICIAVFFGLLVLNALGIFLQNKYFPNEYDEINEYFPNEYEIY